MTWEIGYVLVLLAVGLFLFTKEVLPVDVAALILLLLLVIPPFGVLEPAEALAGFGSETIVTLAGLFVVTAGVTRTGVVERLGLRIANLAREHPTALTRMLLVGVTVVSGFLSNTVTTAAMLPLAIGSARRASIPASKVLMPLAFASILSGGVTLISTSTNLVVSGELPKYGLQPIGFFEMASVGLVITAFGMLYLLFLAPRLIPDRGPGEGAKPGGSREKGNPEEAVPDLGGGTSAGVIDRYGLRQYLSEVIVTPGSPLAGKTLSESRLGEPIDVAVVGVRRGSQRILAPQDGLMLRENDVLLVEGAAEDLLAVKDSAGIEIKPDFRLSDPDLQSENVRMVEAMVMPRSRLIGGTLRDVRFHQRTGVTVLGIHGPGRAAPRVKLSSHILQSGDMLLLQGDLEHLDHLEGDDLMLLRDRSGHHPRSSKGMIATSIFIGAILLATTRVLPLSVAFLVGSLALVLTRCLTTKEAYGSVDWRLLVLIAGMMAFGTAMTKTGAAGLLADLIVEHISGLGTYAVLIAFFLLTLILTQPMSNQAAALVLLPVAVHAAQGMGVNPRSMVMAVTFAASCSFLTPLEPSCVLVYGPGNYRFFDFVRVGGLLTLIVFVVSAFLIPVHWPLDPSVGP